jgi:hypothetical protein
MGLSEIFCYYKQKIRMPAMSEPRLEDIEDYNTLKGEKKKIVFAVILAGLLMGLIYILVYKVFDNKEENLPVTQSANKIPMK